MMNDDATLPPDDMGSEPEEWEEEEDFGRLDPDDDIPGPPRPSYSLTTWNRNGSRSTGGSNG